MAIVCTDAFEDLETDVSIYAEGWHQGLTTVVQVKNVDEV